ncbi:hypothetical protein QTN25_005938 [Entamoeba marina]
MNQSISVDLQEYINLITTKELLANFKEERDSLIQDNEILKKENNTLRTTIDTLRKELEQSHLDVQSKDTQLATKQGEYYRLEGEKNVLLFKFESAQKDLSLLRSEENDYKRKRKYPEIVKTPPFEISPQLPHQPNMIFPGSSVNDHLESPPKPLPFQTNYLPSPHQDTYPASKQTGSPHRRLKHKKQLPKEQKPFKEQAMSEYPSLISEISFEDNMTMIEKLKAMKTNPIPVPSVIEKDKQKDHNQQVPRNDVSVSTTNRLSDDVVTKTLSSVNQNDNNDFKTSTLYQNDSMLATDLSSVKMEKDDESDTMIEEPSDVVDNETECSTHVLFKKKQKTNFVVKYQGVIDVILRVLTTTEYTPKIKGYPSVLAADVFKYYMEDAKIDLLSGITNEKEKKNMLRYCVGCFNKCLKRLEDARARKGFSPKINIITSCYVYIQYLDVLPTS